MSLELKVPQAGESITEVEIGRWLKSEGDAVQKDELLAEIETDKVTMEVLAPADGAMGKVLKQQGETATVGEVIGYVEKGQAGASAADSGKSQATADAAGEQKQAASKDESTTPPVQQPASRQAGERADNGDAPPRIMPAAQRLLEEHNLKPEQVDATGPGGRMLKEDVQRHLEQDDASKPADDQQAEPTGYSGDRQEEIVPMSPMRRRIAERLVEAQHSTAMLTTFNEVDMSAVMQIRSEHRDAFEKRYGIRLGFMSFFVKAAIDALKQFPAINAEIRDRNIIYKNYHDIGIAISSEKGLVVPILRHAERMSFAEIEQNIADYAKQISENRLKLEDLQGGTFTITNGGVFGSMLSTPILNPPQSGVLGMHAIQERPIAVDGQVKIRPMMYLALTYDHRIVDGREAVSFLRRLKQTLEQPSRMLVEI